MIFYITSNTYNEVIFRTVNELELICAGNECTNELYLLKYIRENLNRLGGLDSFIIDLNALQDTDDEILQALDMIRIMNYETRIIILAASRRPGDELLKSCVDMAIYDVITTDVFADIYEELKDSLTVGKKYKDAIRLKQVGQSTQEAVVVKKEIKRTVNKILIGVTGSQHRIGCTHASIVLANYLRKQGYKVALVEFGSRGIWELIREAYGEQLIDERYFSINGVDYYSDAREDELQNLLAVKFYNFIIVDFGTYEDCESFLYNKCDIRLLVVGAKPWETGYVGRIFQNTDSELLKQIHYIFNFVSTDAKEDIRKEMEGLDKIFFLPMSEDPFSAKDIGDMEQIFEFYGQQDSQSSKKKSTGLFGRLRKK